MEKGTPTYWFKGDMPSGFERVSVDNGMIKYMVGLHATKFYILHRTQIDRMFSNNGWACTPRGFVKENLDEDGLIKSMNFALVASDEILYQDSIENPSTAGLFENIYGRLKGGKQQYEMNLDLISFLRKLGFKEREEIHMSRL